MAKKRRPSTFPISKEAMDTLNSVTWFLMDASWMLGAKSVAYSLILPTVLSGIYLLTIEKRRPVFFVNLAILCWILMNSLWMVSDFLHAESYLMAARACFVLGLGFIGLALHLSDSFQDTFSHFKRFRVLNLQPAARRTR